MEINLSMIECLRQKKIFIMVIWVLNWSLLACIVPILIKSENKAALSGAIFQLFGIIIIVMETYNTFKLFNKIKSKQDIVIEIPPCELKLECNLDGCVMNFNDTPENQSKALLEIMFNEIKKLKNSFDIKIKKSQEEILTQFNTDIKELKKINEDIDLENKKLIKSATVGNIQWSIVSLAWMATGIVLTLK
ncbi:MAG: hypothetical protein HQK62_06225 [Desulfamplus sp.]|nr:hypothetical protein [Desulfamplus sp.]